MVVDKKWEAEMSKALDDFAERMTVKITAERDALRAENEELADNFDVASTSLKCVQDACDEWAKRYDALCKERDALVDIITEAPIHLLLNFPTQDHDSQTYAAKAFHEIYKTWRDKAETAIKDDKK